MDKQQRKIYDRKRYLENRESVLKRQKQRRLLNPKEGIERAKYWGKKHPVELAIIQARCQLKAKVEALMHYGKDKLECVKCGEKRIECLTLDHINNDGKKHRDFLGNKAKNLYKLLRQQGYPEDYALQILCRNCQAVKQAEVYKGRRLS